MIVIPLANCVADESQTLNKMRICFVASPPMLQWKIDPRNRNGGRFTGYGIADIFGLYMDALSRIGKNFSVVPDSRLGHEVDGNGEYDGCYGKLQQNHSDLILGDVPIPTIGTNLIHCPVLLSERMAMLSSYVMGTQSKFPDLMSPFEGFHARAWITICLSGCLLSLMSFMVGTLFHKETHGIKKATLKLKFAVLRNMGLLGDATKIVKLERLVSKWKDRAIAKHRSSVELMTSSLLRHFHQADTLTLNSLTMATLAFLMILMGFYVTFFFTSLINTTAVVIKKPSTIDTYDDLIASNMRPIWPAVLDQSKEFATSQPGRKEQLIWQKAVNMGIKESLPSPLDYNPVIKGHHVLIASEVYAQNALVKACWLNKDHRIAPTFPVTRVDDSAPETLTAPMRSGIMDHVVGRKVDHIFRRLFESGFKNMLNHICHLSYKTTARSSQTCQSNRVLNPDQQDVPAIMLSQCQTLLITCSVMAVLSYYIICSELFIHRDF